MARVARWSIGLSVEGRPIIACGLGPSTGRAALVIHGGIHGDEPAAAAVVADLLTEMEGQGEPSRRIVLLPAVNPDGLVLRQKDNARGVDLNRNFAASNFTRTHPLGYDPGPSPLSEPETQALAALIEEARPAVIVAVHQPFACVNYDGPARPLAERMAHAAGFPVVADLGYPTPGSFGSCYGIDRGLPVVTLELPPSHVPWREAGLAALRQAVAAAISI